MTSKTQEIIDIESSSTEQSNELQDKPQTTAISSWQSQELSTQFRKHASDICKSVRFLPKAYQNSPSDCLIAIHTAHQIGIDPMLFMQNTAFINSKPCMSTSLMISLAKRAKVFKGSIKYKVIGEGESLVVEARATLADEDEEVMEKVSFEMAKAEGWTRNDKYRTMPEHMLKYRAATWLIRRYCPEVLVGMHTTDEMVDVKYASQDKELKRIAEMKSANIEKENLAQSQASETQQLTEANKTALDNSDLNSRDGKNSIADNNSSIEEVKSSDNLSERKLSLEENKQAMLYANLKRLMKPDLGNTDDDEHNYYVAASKAIIDGKIAIVIDQISKWQDIPF